MDFPRAWEIAAEKPWQEHNPRCSFRLGEGGLLCDCEVLTRHPEYVADYGDSGMDDLDSSPTWHEVWRDAVRGALAQGDDFEADR